MDKSQGKIFYKTGENPETAEKAFKRNQSSIIQLHNLTNLI